MGATCNYYFHTFYILKNRCVVTSDRPADAVQVCDVGIGGVELEEVLLDLTVAVVTKVQRRGWGEDEEGEEEDE